MATKLVHIVDVKPGPIDVLDIRSRLNRFPCMFNMRVHGLSVRDLNILNNKIKDDLSHGSIPAAERIQMLNFQTWIEYKLDTDCSSAVSRNELTFMYASKAHNVCAIGNKAYLSLLVGNDKQAEGILGYLEKLETDYEFFANLKSQALANQAFAYRRLRGRGNLFTSQRLYETAISMRSEDSLADLYKYQLGLVYRRLTKPNTPYGYGLPKTHSEFIEYKIKARELFKDVAENSSQMILKGRSYAELVFTPSNCHQESRQDQLYFQEKALEFGKMSDDVLLLTVLGRALPLHHPTKVKVLEKSLRIRKTSTACHQLAKWYAAKAKDKMKHEGVTSDTVDTPDVKKALEHFQLAVELEGGINSQARFDYGVFLKKCLQPEAAVEQFHWLINCPLTVINANTRNTAYRMVSECLRECQEKGKQTRGGNSNSELRYLDLNILPKQRLMQAISISAELASKFSGMDMHCVDLWRALLNKGRVIVHPNNVDLVQLIRDNKPDTFALVRKFATDEDDEGVIKTSLDKYLDAGNFHEAMAFLKLAQLRISTFRSNIWNKEPLVSLALKVQLNSAHDLLQHTNEAKVILRSLFTSIYKSDSLDVLLICDELCSANVGPRDTEGSTRQDNFSYKTTQFATTQLESAIGKQFGLDVIVNLQGSQNDGTYTEQIHDEMRRNSVTVILVGPQIGSEFKDLLNSVSSVEPVKKILVVTTHPDVKVPLGLVKYDHLCFKEVENITRLQSQQFFGDGLSKSTLPEQLRDQKVEKSCGEVTDLMKLFCFLIGQEWHSLQINQPFPIARQLRRPSISTHEALEAMEARIANVWTSDSSDVCDEPDADVKEWK